MHMNSQIAEIQISYSTKIPKQERLKITSSRSAYQVLLNSWNINLIELQEEFVVLILNNSNEILGIFNLAKGTVQGVQVDLRLLFTVALKANGVGIIIAHNHPSGSITPSSADIDITEKIKKNGDMLNVKLLDHIILTRDNYYSFADDGKISI